MISVSDLGTALKGRVIAPDDPDYDQARAMFPGGYDRRPALIARVADDADVAKVIARARETGARLAVRSGGHSPFSIVDDAIVLDLREMRRLEIDVRGKTAWAETGLTAAEYSNAAGAHGLATGFGDTGSVGIGGITLGGGIGYLVRKYGLTIDDVLAADVVTADGARVRVDETSHPDLFWAIRGGGGNFGVVTRFQYRLHHVPEFVGGMLMLPGTREAISAFIAAAEAAPEELSTIANVMTAPPMPFVPAEHHGKIVILALMAYAGGAEAGTRALAPFRELATPIVDMVKPISYAEIYPPDDPSYHPIASARTLFRDTFDARAVDTALEHLEMSSAMMRVAQIRVLGGAIARVPADATAFAHRKRRILVNLAAVYERAEEAVQHDAWVTKFLAALTEPGAGAYVNFLEEDESQRIREAYPGKTWERLAAIKTRYDPTNLFRLNQNIPPA